MRKLKKSDYIYATMLYFMLFICFGTMFFAASEVVAWSISIFLIMYFVYWIVVYIRAMMIQVRIKLEFLIEELHEINEKKRKKNGQ